MEEIRKYVLQQKDQVIETRRALHRIPELANQEEETSAYVATYLANEGLNVQTGVAGHGVVGTLTCEKPGPALMIRADMDALPFKEETGLPFSSIHDGVMHACGHDAHMAMALVATTVLNKMKAGLKGCVKFVFQPAEEGPGGAKRMIDAGILDTPRVDFSVGCHLWAD